MHGELLWSQASAAGTCLHTISPIRHRDSGAAIYDSPDPDARIIGMHVGGNERKDAAGVGVFVQASYIIEAAVGIGTNRTSECFPA